MDYIKNNKFVGFLINNTYKNGNSNRSLQLPKPRRPRNEFNFDW
jgi:hypothetical protein